MSLKNPLRMIFFDNRFGDVLFNFDKSAVML